MQLALQRLSSVLSRLYELFGSFGEPICRPPITLWEHKLARKRLLQQRHAVIDEASLFAAVDDMREIEHRAKKLTRSARRHRTRRQHHLTAASLSTTTNTETPTPTTMPFSAGVITRFADIESW